MSELISKDTYERDTPDADRAFDELVERVSASPEARLRLLRGVLGEAVCRQLGICLLPKGFTLSVVIPVYNEREWVLELLARVRSVPVPKEIIIVDDCSTDGTREVLRSLDEDGVILAFHDANQGKGAALRTGFALAGGDIVLVEDADLEYDPADYMKLIQPILDGRADVVFGSRFIGETHRVLYFWHSVANRMLTMLSNMFTNLNLTDMETCYKAFRREALAGLVLRSNRFGFEPEITAKVARKGCRIYEVPISYSGRTYEEGKKIGLADAFNALYCIIRYCWAD